MTAPTTATEINTLGGKPGDPAIFKARYDGHRWHARKVADEVYLSRTCTGCWSAAPGYTGMWNPRRHHAETMVTVQEIADAETRIARLRTAGEDEIADEQQARAFHILPR